MSRARGISEAKLLAVDDFEHSDQFTGLEKLVVRYAALLTVTPVEVPEDLFAALRSQLTDAQLVELTAAIAWENYRARFFHAFGAEAEGFCQLR